MKKNCILCVLLISFMTSFTFAAVRYKINALVQDPVAWANDGDIHIFDFTFGKVKPARNANFFKVDCLHEGLWVRNYRGDLPAGIGYRIIHISTDGALVFGKVGPTLDKNAKKGSADEILGRAKVAYGIGNFKAALPLFMQVYNKFPVNRASPYAIFMAGQSLCALKQYKESISLHSAMIKRYPTSKLVPAALFRIACVTIGLLDQEAEGDAIFTLIIKRYPRNRYAADALFTASALKLIKGDVSGAVAGFKRVVKQYPSSYRANVARNNLIQLVKQLATK